MLLGDGRILLGEDWMPLGDADGRMSLGDGRILLGDVWMPLGEPVILT
jgi:hypothetical protein